MTTKTIGGKRPAPKSSEGSSPKIAKNVLSRKSADGSVAIMKLDNDEYFFTLDGFAAQIWLKINGKTKLSKIKEQMIKQFAPPPARFEKDLKNLLAALKKEKLIEF